MHVVAVSAPLKSEVVDIHHYAFNRFFNSVNAVVYETYLDTSDPPIAYVPRKILAPLT